MAWRTRFLKAEASNSSPSWISIARRMFPSRLALNRRVESLNEAPLAKVSFTLSLYDSPVQMMPSCDHTGVPIHFHSSTTSGSSSAMSLRILLSVAPRQSPSSVILCVMSSVADRAGPASCFFICASYCFYAVSESFRKYLLATCLPIPATLGPFSFTGALCPKPFTPHPFPCFSKCWGG